MLQTKQKYIKTDNWNVQIKQNIIWEKIFNKIQIGNNNRVVFFQFIFLVLINSITLEYSLLFVTHEWVLKFRVTTSSASVYKTIIDYLLLIIYIWTALLYI